MCVCVVFQVRKSEYLGIFISSYSFPGNTHTVSAKISRVSRINILCFTSFNLLCFTHEEVVSQGADDQT